MQWFVKSSGLCVALAAMVSAIPLSDGPFDAVFNKWQSSSSSSRTLVVDLGYERYQGAYNPSTGLNSWLGIRYAAPPTGRMRWQAPRPPAVNRTSILPGDNFASRCPQAPSSPLVPGGYFSGDEDCLFLSVYSPQNATNLPVVVWIHGGGYGQGKGDEPLSPMINGNNNSFIGIAIQYRLGAFGFLSSDEVHKSGVANAGLLDQTFALRWLQKYIHLFGGDPSRVTIGGQSAGGQLLRFAQYHESLTTGFLKGGSVMMQAMAYGGNLKSLLFQNLIAASPFLGQQHGYADPAPTEAYYALAEAVGCFPGAPSANYKDTVFNCLLKADTNLLQSANVNVSSSGRFGTWAFLPVTDGVYIQNTPSKQLPSEQVNGMNMLVGNNANEGPAFVPQNITTEAGFVAFVRFNFPQFTEDDIAQVLLTYPSTSEPVDPSIPRFATSGTSDATALNESTFGTGQQQRANNLYAETAFVCPSYWLAEGFSDHGRKAYKYQYSVIGAQHGADISAYTDVPPTPTQSRDFVKAFETIWGNFIRTGNPSISGFIAAGSSQPSTPPNPITAWPPYTLSSPQQINMNETGGVPFEAGSFSGTAPAIIEFEDPGLRNAFGLVDARTWEGGRGARCDFWKRVGGRVPE